MTATAFVHGGDDGPTTLSEIHRITEAVVPTDFLGAYAYATQSGFAAFNLEMGMQFWADTPTRWLFGLDYGRTQPRAIRSLIEKTNSQVRIFDGAWIVEREGFLPRHDFHAKVALVQNSSEARFGMVVGSGNFSSNGLRRSVEAGATFYVTAEEEHTGSLARSIQSLSALWNDATPAEAVVDAYEERWSASFWRGGEQDEGVVGDEAADVDVFWIEAGYVTRNRGSDRPGNQIDFPRGMSRYFGFDPPDDLPIKSVIGEVTFQPPVGGSVTRNLRLGNNHMEKVSLPTPENHGFDIYDGKVLVFQRTNGPFVMNALEVADFESAFGDRLADVRTMASGRRYGHIA